MGWQDFPVAGGGGQTQAPPSWQSYPVESAAPQQPAAPAAAQNAPGLFDTNQIARNLTFGLSDKAAALGSAVGASLPGSAHPGGFWDTYSNRLAELRKGAGEYAQAHPVAAIAGPLAGGLIAAPAAAAVAVPTMGQAIGQGAKAGAAVGAAQGFAGADENPLRDTLLGAAGGAAIGVVAPPAVQLMRPMVEGFQRLMPSYFPGAVEKQALKRIGERVGQDAEAGGPSVAEMAQTLSEAPGKPQGIVDVAGENVRGLAGQLARTPGTSREIARNFFSTRDVDAGSRLLGDIDQSISSGGSAHDAVQSLIQQRAQAAAPLYEKAWSNPVNISPEIENFIKHPIIQSGLVNGREIQDLERLAGHPVPPPQSVWGQLDAAKRGLDDMIEKYRDPTTGRLALDQRGRALNQVRASYLAAMDKANPDYAAARQAYAGPSSSMEAINRGRSFQSMRPEEIRDQISGMGQGEKDFFLLGVADKLRNDVLKTATNGDEAKRLINNQYVQDQLRPMFDSDAAHKKFIDAVTAERRMFETKGPVIGNSATASRMAEDTHGGSPMANLAAGAAGLLAHEPFAAGHFLLRGLRSGYEALGKPNAALREAMARALFNPNAKINEKFLQDIANRRLPPQAAPLLIAPGARAAGVLLPGYLNAGSSP